MARAHTAAAILTALLAVIVPQLPAQARQAKAPSVNVGDRKISGPYSHANLDIFLVHRKDAKLSPRYLCLSEALRKHTLEVRETGTVQQLVFENRSARNSVYVQSGEIVKGGRQDRTIRYDNVVPPKSGKVPVASFCVESGRWSRRGKESGKRFSAGGYLSTRKLRLAAKADDDAQNKVWSQVALTQERLNRLLDAQVRDDRSPTSLQLTLESKGLRKRVKKYTDALADTPKRWKHVVGFCFAVNGQIVGGDVYASRALFLKMWPKLLGAGAVEAIVEHDTKKKVEPAKLGAVQAFLIAAEAGQPGKKPAPNGLKTVVYESKEAVLFELRPPDRTLPAIHESYVSK